MKHLIVFLVILGIYPLRINAQDSRTRTNPPKNQGRSAILNRRVIDTMILTPDGQTQWLFMSSSNYYDADSTLNIWSGFPSSNALREFEQTQEQMLKQIYDDANRFNRWKEEQQALQNEKFKQYWKAQKTALFIDIMELTPEESEKFWPIYNEYNDKREAITGKRQNINKTLRNATLYNISEKEADALAREYVTSYQQEINLQQEYYRRFKTILKPNKLLMIYKAEDAFKLLMLQNRGVIPD